MLDIPRCIKKIVYSILDGIDHGRLMRIKRGGRGDQGHEAQGAQQTASVAEEMKFVRVFMSLSDDERQLIGHNFTSFIKACSYRGRTCTDKA